MLTSQTVSNYPDCIKDSLQQPIQLLFLKHTPKSKVLTIKLVLIDFQGVPSFSKADTAIVEGSYRQELSYLPKDRIQSCGPHRG